MRVDDKIPLAEYCRAYNGNRIDAEHDLLEDDRSALISRHFFYFGRNAIDIAEIPRKHLNHDLEKRGPGYRCDFSEKFVESFASRLEASFKCGIHGLPCQPLPELRVSRCSSRVRRRK